MKKLLGIVVLGLLWCNVAFSKMYVIENELMNLKDYDSSSVATACIDGYKFVIVRGTRAISVTQFYKEVDGKSLPEKC